MDLIFLIPFVFDSIAKKSTAHITSRKLSYPFRYMHESDNIYIILLKKAFFKKNNCFELLCLVLQNIHANIWQKSYFKLPQPSSNPKKCLFQFLKLKCQHFLIDFRFLHWLQQTSYHSQRQTSRRTQSQLLSYQHIATSNFLQDDPCFF